MIRCILMTCIAVLTICMLCMPVCSQVEMSEEVSLYSSTTPPFTAPVGTGVLSSKAHSANDDSDRINWGLCFTGVCAAYGAFSGFGSSGSNAETGRSSNAAAAVTSLINENSMLESEPLIAVDGSVVPDAPSILLFVIGLPGLLKIARRTEH